MGPEIPQQRDLGQMVNHLAVDVQGQVSEGPIAPRALGRSARLLHALVVHAAQAVEPALDLAIELGEGLVGGARELPRAVGASKWLWLRAASTPTITCPRRHAIVVNGWG